MASGAFNKSSFIADVSAAANQITTAVQNGDTAGVVAGTAALGASLPGPQQTGAALASFGLSGLPAGHSYSTTGTMSPNQVVSMALAGAGLVTAGLAAAGVVAVAGVPVAIAAGVVGFASAFNGFFPDAVDSAYYSMEKFFLDLASGKILDDVLDSFGDWWLENVLPILLPDDGISSTVNADFNAALITASPMILDLDGDGIETFGANGQVLFDHDGDGDKHGSGWVKSDDGLLVLDINGNGTIDSGRELFGENTLLADGFVEQVDDGSYALGTAVIGSILIGALSLSVSMGIQDKALQDPDLRCHLDISDHGENVKVVISDTGKPIADPERVFQPFYSTKPGGLGIGLYHVQYLVDSMKGQIACKNSEQGVAFELLIPKS